MGGLFAMAGRVRSGSTKANGKAAKAEVIEAVGRGGNDRKDQGRSKYCDSASVAIAVASTKGTRQLRTGDIWRARGGGVVRWMGGQRCSGR